MDDPSPTAERSLAGRLKRVLASRSMPSEADATAPCAAPDPRPSSPTSSTASGASATDDAPRDPD